MAKFCAILGVIAAFLTICDHLIHLSKEQSFLATILIVGKSKLMRYIMYSLSSILLITGLLLAFNIGTISYIKYNNLFFAYMIFTCISLYFIATSYFAFKLTDLGK